MSGHEFTADRLEEIFHAALAAGDTKGVDAALRVMVTVDPRRASDLYDSLVLAIQLARSERGSSSLPAVLPALVTALLLVLSVAYREPVRTLVWLTPLALLLLAVVVGCVWLAGRLTARPPMTEHLRDEAAVLIERSK